MIVDWQFGHQPHLAPLLAQRRFHCLRRTFDYRCCLWCCSCKLNLLYIDLYFVEFVSFFLMYIFFYVLEYFFCSAILPLSLVARLCVRLSLTMARITSSPSLFRVKIRDFDQKKKPPILTYICYC